MFTRTEYTKGQGVSTLITKTMFGKVIKIETLAVFPGTGSEYKYTVQVPGQSPVSSVIGDMAGERIARRFHGA